MKSTQGKSGQEIQDTRIKPVSDLPEPSIDLQEIPDRLHFNTKEGLIWLADRRMVMMNMEALGALRQEMIESLGLEAARGLLTRFGYSAGCRDAELALKLYKDQADTLDIISAGPKFHALQGIALVDMVGGKIDIENGTCDVEFNWRNCFEAHVHAQTYGIGDTAACWTETGYASGFISTCVGKRVIVREVECSAQGFDSCRCIARPVEEWDNIEEELSYYNAASFNPSPASNSFNKKTSISASKLGKTPLEEGEQIIGASVPFNVLMHKIKRVAPTNATVLFLGESGVGKSALAAEVCKLSSRANNPFLEVNCAAIPEQLIESELFGAEKGAFTGATVSRKGRFQNADGGTLFLDEIGTLSMTAQGKLLRVIQTGKFEPLGSSQSLTVDVRIIAATNEDLMQLVKEGKFREDLFYRLNVFPIEIPPLRQRRDDIPVLLERLINRYCNEHKRSLSGISSKALQLLLNYSWPGNIRELENVIERGIILADDNHPLAPHHLFTIDGSIGDDSMTSLNELGRLKGSSDGLSLAERSDEFIVEQESLAIWSQGVIERENLSLDDIENALFAAAYRQAKGNYSKAAEKLGITRAQFSYRAKKLGLDAD